MLCYLYLKNNLAILFSTDMKLCDMVRKQQLTVEELMCTGILYLLVYFILYYTLH